MGASLDSFVKYTETAPKLFINTGTKFPRRIVWAMGLVKYSAAEVNSNLGLLDKRIAEAITAVAKDLMDGKLDDRIVLERHLHHLLP